MTEIKCLIKELNPYHSYSKSNALVAELRRLMIKIYLFL